MTIITPTGISGISSLNAGTTNTLAFYDNTGSATNLSLLVGSASSTGTASQRLQITGGAYVSGSVGVGTTNPGTTFDIAGTLRATTITGVTTAGITTAYIGAINDGPISGARNRIINGDMRIDQRNSGAGLASAADASYAVDRWVRYQNVGVSTIGQNLNSITSVSGFPNYLGIQITTAGTASAAQYTNYQQYIEGFNTADLAWGTSDAKTITISFWVRSSLTGNFGIGLQNATSNRGYPTTYTINSANTWEYKSVTIPGDTTGTWNTTNGRGIALIFDLGQGSNYRFAAGSWSANNVQGATGAVSLNQTLNATWYITGVQLEAGTVATPFERRSYGQELALCQRYYYRTADNQNSAALAIGGIESATTASVAVRHPVDMRATPTITFGSGLRFFSFGTGTLTPTINTNRSTAQLASLIVNISGATGGQVAFLYNASNTNSYFEASTEL